MSNLMKKIIGLLCVVLLQGSNVCLSENYRADLRRNPFVRSVNIDTDYNTLNPENQSNFDIGEISLRATLTSKNHSSANINGEILFVGQSIRGYQLVEINVGKVLIRKNNNDEILFVNDNYGDLR